MRTVATLLILSLVNCQFALAQAVVNDQSTLFDHLGISKQTPMKDRVDACAKTLSGVREKPIPREFYEGLGLVMGSATLSSYLGNLTKKDIGKIDAQLAAIEAKTEEGFSPTKSTDPSVELSTIEIRIRRIARNIENAGNPNAGSGDLSWNRSHLTPEELKMFKKKISHIMEQQSVSPQQLVQELTALKVKLEGMKDTVTPAGFDTGLALRSEVRRVESLLHNLDNEYLFWNNHFSDIVPSLEDFKQLKATNSEALVGSDSLLQGRFTGRSSALFEMTEMGELTKTQLASRAKAIRALGYTGLAAGTAFALYGVVAAVKDAADSKSSIYNVKTAANGNPRGICLKAVGDEYDSSAAQSLNKFFDAAAAVNVYNELQASSPSGVQPGKGGGATK